MNNKEEIKKQLIILGLILILVIIVAIILNTNKTQVDTAINTKRYNEVQSEKKEENILDNLKGLLEESTEEYVQDETQGIKENKITTQNGETIIVRE